MSGDHNMNCSSNQIINPPTDSMRIQFLESRVAILEMAFANMRGHPYWPATPWPGITCNGAR